MECIQDFSGETSWKMATEGTEKQTEGCDTMDIRKVAVTIGGRWKWLRIMSNGNLWYQWC